MGEFNVLENYGKIVIGYETGVPLGVMKIGENVKEIEHNGQMSKIKGFVVDIPIRSVVKPVAQPYRRVPVPLKEAVDKKIDELSEQGIIEKVTENILNCQLNEKFWRAFWKILTQVHEPLVQVDFADRSGPKEW